MTLEQDPVDAEPRDELVVRARTDREAFGELYDAAYPGVFRYCLRRLFVRAVAEDVTSEVFLSVASEISRFGGTTDEDFRRWVFRIATNAVNAYIRQGNRRRALLETAARNGAIGPAVAQTLPKSDAERPDWPAVYRAILGLKPRDQAIVVLRFFDGMSHDEIAAALGQRPGTVRVALKRAIERLRRRLNINDQ